jgi:hypothetical protein
VRLALQKWGRRQELVAAVEELPQRTREAMLEGLAGEKIIAGAYTDSRGGVCPMLAAHRRGERTSGAVFARAWDRFTGASRPVHADPDDLRTLRALLDKSLASNCAPQAWLRPVRRYDDFCSALEDLGVDEDVSLDSAGGRRPSRPVVGAEGASR